MGLADTKARYLCKIHLWQVLSEVKVEPGQAAAKGCQFTVCLSFPSSVPVGIQLGNITLLKGLGSKG